TDAGGMIVAIGRHPNSTAEYGRNDRFLTDTIRSWMAGNAPKHPTVYHYARDVTDAVQWLRKVLPPLVIVEDGDALMSQCRRIGDAMFFLLFNPTAHERDTWVQLRAVGIPYLWDAETGMVTKLSEFAHTNAYTRMRIRMTPYQAVIIAIRNSAQRASTARDSRKVRLRYGAVERMASEGIGSHVTVPASIELDGEWEFQLEPTCDNRFGDFRRPPSPTKLGAECRRMHCRRELIGEDGVRLGWHLNDFDDSTWVQATYSVGPYFWWLGPIDNPRRERGFDGRLPPEIDTQAQSYNLFGKRMRWKLYWFSKQFGIEKDATYWRTLGPKKRVPLEYINLGRAREWSIAYLRTWLKAQEPMKVQVTLGGMAAKRIWVNGIEVGSVPSISRQRMRTDVELRAGNNLLLIKLAYPRDEHLRVYLDVRKRKPVERTLQWIWHPQPPSDKVSYCFRRRFKLPVRPKHATISITADNGYELFINGKFIGRELGFDTHFWKSAEQFDVTKQLRSGDNVIAVRATNLGGPGGLLLHVAIRLPSDKVVHIYSDGTWRCAPADSVEAKGKNAWTSLAFDDSQWQTVATLGAPPVEPWGNIFGMTMPAMPQAPALRWFVEPMPAPFDVFPGDEKRIWWYRFKLPPGTKAIAMRVKCTRIEVYVRGKPLFKRELGIGEHVIRVPVGNLANREGAVCAVRLRTLPGEYGGAVFTTPVAFKTERGRISLGAWAERGLQCYSGIGVYSRLVKLPSAVASKNVRAILELGDVRCTAEVFVNGERVGIRAWSPYRFDITPFVHPGMNRITIKVANTLANHYSVGLPSPYVYAGTTISGLLGPVRIRFEGL
ncbi:MAG TPA: hypothetical protein EYP10_04950, partial [Armatimonadetes bacterium]|nr:hypothetical protein [Armatimonadota bacterium]